MGTKTNKTNIQTETIINEITDALKNLKYGYLQITVHDSKIVQIERTEKTRFNDIRLGGGDKQ